MSGQRPWPPGLWTVVLAAGGARRFGRNKLLTRLGPQTLLRRAARQASAVSGARCIVVLGGEAGRLAAELAGLPLQVVVNRRWRDGMAGSLQAGLAALPTSARGALIVLADQYAIGAGDLRRLARDWARRPSVPAAALVDGRPGAPAILPACHFGQVASLHGDQGARALLRLAGAALTRVPLPAAAWDLDHRGELGTLRRRGRRLR